jgi:hypothetical protein
MHLPLTWANGDRIFATPSQACAQLRQRTSRYRSTIRVKLQYACAGAVVVPTRFGVMILWLVACAARSGLSRTFISAIHAYTFS